MPIRSFRGVSAVVLLGGCLGFGGGCGGQETGDQVPVNKEKADALLNSMSGYSGYAKKGKSKDAPASKPAPAAAPKS